MAEHPHITLVRQGYDAFSAGDPERLMQFIAHDAVQHIPGQNVISGDQKGIEAILAQFGKMGQETGGTLRVELEHLFTDGHGRVVTVHRFTGTRNGKAADHRECLVFDIVDDKAHSMTLTTEDIEKFDEFWG